MLKGLSQIVPGARTASKNYYLSHIILLTVRDPGVICESPFTVGVIARCRATGLWRKNDNIVHLYVACTQQVTRRGVLFARHYTTSKYVWNLKKQNIDYKINLSILRYTKLYSNASIMSFGKNLYNHNSY